MNNCPDWLEAETYDYAKSVVESMLQCPDDLETLHCNDAYRALMSPDLSHVWRRAKRFFADEAARGQIDLFVLLITCRKWTDKTYGTKAEVLAWRELFLSKLDELQDLWINMPAGLWISDARYMQLRTAADKPGDSEDMIAKLDSIMPQNTPLAPLANMRDAMLESFHYDPHHLAQVRGSKAERVYFVRTISRFIMRSTGQWKREIVADITSFLFECTFTAADVIRCTKDVPQETQEADTF